MELKSGVRILALNGAPFGRKEKEELVIGIIGRQRSIEGALSFKVRIDGKDSSERLIHALNKSKFREQVRIVAMNGIALGGLNIIDPERVAEELNCAFVAVTRKRPRRSLLKKVLSKDPERKIKLEIVERTYRKVKIARMDGFYVQFIGIEEGNVRKILPDLILFLRTAHIMASSLALGESKGRI